MEYILCQFNFGYSGQFYQEIENLSIVRLVDLDGNTLELPSSISDPNYVIYGYSVIDANPPRPSWAK